MSCFIEKRVSAKSGKEYVCLVLNGVIVSFDVLTICRVANLSPNFPLAMKIGDKIDIVNK